MEAHAARYPAMQPQDAAKLLYQNEFGPGHLITDPADSLRRLQEEQSGAPREGVLFEPIGGGLCRLYLGPAAQEEIPVETIHRLFLACAGQPRGSKEGLLQKLSQLPAEQMPFGRQEWDAYRAAYCAEGCPMVRHSAIYRAQYRPAYRVVEAFAAVYWPFFAALDRLLMEKETVTVAIDGNSGAGKSSLASMAAALYGATVYHMDDYFLPPHRKTPERLAQPGGNVDYERFAGEIGAGLAGGGAFYYRPYCCRTGALGAPVRSVPQRLRIVEGVYSLHPALQGLYDFKVFLTVPPEEQSRRILNRSGALLHRRFLEEWIPLEEAYFSQCQIRRQCQLVLETGSSQCLRLLHEGEGR